MSDRTSLEEFYRAFSNKYGGAFPTFDWESDQKVECCIMDGQAYDWRDVEEKGLGECKSIAERFRAVNNYAGEFDCYIGAYPTFHQRRKKNGNIFGCVLIKKDYVDHQDVNVDELKDFSNGNSNIPINICSSSSRNF